jgi:hypothetical protein
MTSVSIQIFNANIFQPTKQKKMRERETAQVSERIETGP